MLIKTFRFFLIIVLFSSIVVWLSNNPGKVEIVWKNYLLETNLFGLIFAFLFIILKLFKRITLLKFKILKNDSILQNLKISKFDLFFVVF